MTCEQWVEIVMSCTNRSEAGVEQWCWPDGAAYLEQESIVIAVFSVVKQEIGEIMEKPSPLFPPLPPVPNSNRQ